MCLEIWKLSNLLTFVGLIFSIIGLQMCFNQMHNIAIILLILSGICDTFDGYVANKFKKTEKEKEYGIQLDSLVDIISSGIFPIVFCLSMGFNHIIDIIVYSFFAICGITRLVYFNINTKKDNKAFIGIPITVSTMLFPILYLLTKNEIIYIISMLLLALLYISKIKINKPNIFHKIFLSLCGIILIIFILLRTGGII